MKKLLLVIFIFLTLVPITYSQLSAVKCDPPEPVSYSPDWGTNLLVSGTEPQGRPSGVYRLTDNRLFVCIPDTNISSGRGIVCLTSTNNGLNWSNYSFIQPAFYTPKVKVVKTGTDSVYCFFTYETTIYCWNVVTGYLNAFTNYTTIRDFDAEASSTGGLYIIADLNTNNDVRIFGSPNSGLTWTQSSFMSSTAAHPRWSKTLYGDTLLINYYAITTGITDTLTAAVRNVRYRETALGTLAVTGSFLTIITPGAKKLQYKSVIDGLNAVVIYSKDTLGSIDLYYMVSNNSGVSYSAPQLVVNSPTRDDYWFDAKAYTMGSGGVDLIYYSDSLQAGPATNQSDKLMYSYLIYSLSSFSNPVQISSYPPGWSVNEYIPFLIEYYNPSGDLAAYWVGGSPKKLYMNRYLTTGIRHNDNTVAAKYSLSQNYPNPFNPITKIDFSIPSQGLVTLKVYDILGKEVAVLIDKNLTSGNYSVDFDASKLNSGVYFYKLSSGNFAETKKMMVIK